MDRTKSGWARTMLAAATAGILASGGSAMGADPNSYGAVRDFLVSKTKVVELTGEQGQRVAICPEYQGRVMTSTTADVQGRSLGWVNTAFIESGDKDPHFNNYGGEDRLWLAPEGGPLRPVVRPAATIRPWPIGSRRRRSTTARSRSSPARTNPTTASAGG